MTRQEKAALRAQGRERRRRPEDEESRDVRPQDESESEQAQHEVEEESPPRHNGRQREERRPRKREPLSGASREDLAEIAEAARELLRSLRNVDAESVSGVERTPNGWKVTLEVLELRRIPESTDVLASYEIELDGDRQFLTFSRGRRYHRAQAESGGGR